MPLLTRSQIKRLSNIFDNAGQVFLGSLVVTPILSANVFAGAFATATFGILSTVLMWFISLTLERKSV